MARKRIGMRKIREVIRLKSTTAMSDRQIARALNVSRPVVTKYWHGFQSLINLIEKPRIEKSNKYKQLVQYFPYFVIELQRPGVTLLLLWQEYKRKRPEGSSTPSSAITFFSGGVPLRLGCISNTKPATRSLPTMPAISFRILTGRAVR